MIISHLKILYFYMKIRSLVSYFPILISKRHHIIRITKNWVTSTSISRLFSISSNFRMSESIYSSHNELISYVTDCEGNYDYWCRYLKISSVIYEDEGKNLILINDS